MIKSTKHYRICGYVRVSTEEQAESPEGSIKNQEERIRQAVRHKLEAGASVELVNIYVDAGLSAKDMKRPALQRMLNAVEKHEINLVVVTELSRLSRNTKDFCEMWEFFEAHGCEFFSLREHFDTTTAAGVLMLKSLANFAEFERRQTAERISASFKVRAERGLWNGGPVPFGYRPVGDKTGRLKVEEEEAKVVRAAFQAFLDNESLSTASKWLNDHNYKLSKKMVNGGSHRVGHFLIDTLHHILTNKSYIGVRVFNTKEGKKESKALWDAIIDEVTFASVQSKLAKNHMRKKPHTKKRYPYTLTGIIFCGVCGDSLCGKSAHGKRKKYPFYEHAKVNKSQGTLTKQIYTCQPHRFPGEVVEQNVWKAVEELICNPSVAKEILVQAKREHSKVDFSQEEDRLKNKVYAIQGQLNALTERLSEIPTDVDATPIYNQMKKIGIMKKELEGKILTARRQGHEHELPAELSDYLEFLKLLKGNGKIVLTPLERQKIIGMLVEKIELLPEGMKIHYFVGTSRIKKGPDKTGPSLYADRCSTSLTIGGDMRDRTADLFTASEALSQLSYAPKI